MNSQFRRFRVMPRWRAPENADAYMPGYCDDDAVDRGRIRRAVQAAAEDRELRRKLREVWE